MHSACLPPLAKQKVGIWIFHTHAKHSLQPFPTPLQGSWASNAPLANPKKVRQVDHCWFSTFYYVSSKRHIVTNNRAVKSHLLSSGQGGSVQESSHEPKCRRFYYQLGHMPRLQVQSPVWAHAAGDQSVFLSLPFSLPYLSPKSISISFGKDFF